MEAVMRALLRAKEAPVSSCTPGVSSARPTARRPTRLAPLLLALAASAGCYAGKLRDEQAQTAGLQTKLTSCTEEAERAKAELLTCRSDVSDLEQQQQEAEAQRKEFDAISEKLRKLIDTGKLEVELRRGQMVVKLPAAILFASGSAELSLEGEEALAELAAVLKAVPRRRFIVAGHTDNIPLSKDDTFKSNWELSAARAVSVLTVLIAKGMKPQNLIAAGYGEYSPVASNGTPAGRQKNRRIEIIVEPDLSKLPLPKSAEK
jgi:chemotaxis protein MotB